MCSPLPLLFLMLRSFEFDRPTIAPSAPTTVHSAQISNSTRKIHSRRSSSAATVQNARRRHQFHGLGPISLLFLPRDLSSKPIIQLSLELSAADLLSTEAATPNHNFTTFNDDKHDPNELCILPSLSAQPPFSLQPIPELSDEEYDQAPPTPRVGSPVLFVNAFGAPAQNPNGQLPSPPQTPSLSDSLPPHLREEEEEEDALSSSEPVNLTGRIKKLVDPPIVCVPTRLAEACADLSAIGSRWNVRYLLWRVAAAYSETCTSLGIVLRPIFLTSRRWLLKYCVRRVPIRL